MAEWAWDPDDFAALWIGDRSDRIPNILRYTSRFAYRDDVAAHRLAVRRGYDAGELELIELAMNTLTASDLRIEIIGGTTTYQGSNGSQPRVYRIIGARTTSHAAVLHQFTQGDRDGQFRLCLCRTENLPARIVATIPAAPAGTQPPITVHPSDIREGRPSRTGNSPAERYRRIFDGPMHGSGAATLRAGAFNATPAPWNRLAWYDIPDGRYTETRAENVTVRPVSAQDLAARFAAWINTAVDRLREDEDEPW